MAEKLKPSDGIGQNALRKLQATTGDVEALEPVVTNMPANVPLTTPSVQDVIDALVLLGLVEQSDP